MELRISCWELAVHLEALREMKRGNNLQEPLVQLGKRPPSPPLIDNTSPLLPEGPPKAETLCFGVG